MPPSAGGQPVSLLEVRDLSVSFPVSSGLFGRPKSWIRAVDGVSLRLEAGETLGLVGESGCGKSTTGRAILRLLEADAGTISVNDTDVRKLSRSALRLFRHNMQLVMQDPMAALDPRCTAFQAVAEGLEIHDLAPRSAWRDRVRALFDLVGLSDDHLDRYPHEFSGGQRQRIGIARALAVEPKLLILDEPVSALDVSVQAQIVNLLEDIQERMGVGYLFVAHDLGVVRHLSDRIAVMYLGRIVEEGAAEDICRSPLHPYTRMLLASVPGMGRGKRIAAPPMGELPSPSSPPTGCVFHPRCSLAVPSCKTERPALVESGVGRRCACPLAGWIDFSSSAKAGRSPVRS
jgi:oligopeptide/dipeptide ABC transporter ATP-binding protein